MIPAMLVLVRSSANNLLLILLMRPLCSESHPSPHHLEATHCVSGSERSAAASAMLAPRVAVVDGRIVVDEASLAAPAQEARGASLAEYRRVEEHHPRLNYASHMKREKSERWTEDETARWYRVSGGGGREGGSG